jgi:hypothetical protein
MWKLVFIFFSLSCLIQYSKSQDEPVGFDKRHPEGPIRDCLTLIDLFKEAYNSEDSGRISDCGVDLSRLIVAISHFGDLELEREYFEVLKSIPENLQGVEIPSYVMFLNEYEIALKGLLGKNIDVSEPTSFGAARIPSFFDPNPRSLDSVIKYSISIFQDRLKNNPTKK